MVRLVLELELSTQQQRSRQSGLVRAPTSMRGAAHARCSAASRGQDAAERGGGSRVNRPVVPLWQRVLAAMAWRG
jgi:hypothetical protein